MRSMFYQCYRGLIYSAQALGEYDRGRVAWVYIADQRWSMQHIAGVVNTALCGFAGIAFALMLCKQPVAQLQLRPPWRLP